MGASVVCTAVFAVILVIALERNRNADISAHAEASASDSPREPHGVVATITAGDLRIERALATLDFALGAGDSIDAEIPPGPFRVEFTAAFVTGKTREAQLGAEFQGGKLIVMHKDRPIISDFAGVEPRTTITNPGLPNYLEPEWDEITVIFQNDGTRPSRLRALWQPENAERPLPLPVVASAP
jgi:hypothetical protein